MSSHAYIYDAIRTPRSKGKPDGTLHEVKPIALAAGLLNELQARHDFDTACVDDVILGCVTPVKDQGTNIAKCAVQYAGWDNSVAGVQLNRFCASGLEAVNIAAQKVISGWEQLIVAGGVESMSRVPMGSDGGVVVFDPEYLMGQVATPQGVGADLIATIEGWDREDVDAFAVESQRRAAHARDSGYFDRSVVPVKDRNGVTILERDDFIKPDTSMQGLTRLKASFSYAATNGMDATALSKYPQLDRINHVHHAGNASGIVDGAATVLIGSEQMGKDLGLSPRGRIVAGVIIANEPTIMLTGPGPSAEKCLKVAGMTKADIDLWEINEAFSSVAMRYMRDLGIDAEVTNVNGGAIAMGHPLGATGAALLSTMLDELERRGLKRGMVSMCVGGGMGISTIIERL
ncbi:MAG: acetyl-CoA C-acetyltransferase [Sphingomonas sp.]|uniref:acetyl-CoA C-acetyltransferase n=1 Tax=Sphingomonas sp. TaxID=28214 RepID=UPI0035A8AE45|nr:acetyl-CoA C-acetyltransferase [Sphingomonas sp.]